MSNAQAVVDLESRFDTKGTEMALYVRAEIGFALEERRSAWEAKRMVLDMVQREYPGAVVTDFEIGDTLGFSGWWLTVEHPPGRSQTIRARH